MRDRSEEDDNYHRENYQILIISLLDTDIEDSQHIKTRIYLNNELDDTIELNSSTSIFIHSLDSIKFEIVNFLPPQTIGLIDITMNELLSQSETIFQQWIPSIYNKRVHKFLFQFEIHKIESFNQIQQKDNLPQRNSGSPITSPQNDMYPSIDQSNPYKIADPIQTPPSINYQMPESKLNGGKQGIRQGYTSPYSQTKNKPKPNLSQIMTTEDDPTKKIGYKFQKLNQYTPSRQQQQKEKEEENDDQKAFLKDNMSSFIMNNGPYGNGLTHMYDALEEDIVKLTRKIHNKTFNKLIERRRDKFVVLKNMLKEITEEFEKLKTHPCRGCEKKYIPSIQKGIMQLNLSYNQLRSYAEQTQEGVLIQEKRQQFKEKTDLMPSSRSRTKSPIFKKNSEKIIPTTPNSKPKFSVSPKIVKSPKIIKPLEVEQEVKNLQVNANFVRRQLEMQVSRTTELETENKQLKLRNFVLEADLKNLLKRFSLEKISLSSKSSFKLQEFRYIFEYFHSLIAERESLLNEINVLSSELETTNTEHSRISSRALNDKGRQSKATIPPQLPQKYEAPFHYDDDLSAENNYNQVLNDNYVLQNEIYQADQFNQYTPLDNLRMNDRSSRERSEEYRGTPPNNNLNLQNGNQKFISPLHETAYSKIEDDKMPQFRSPQDNRQEYPVSPIKTQAQNRQEESSADKLKIFNLLNQRKTTMNELIEKIGAM